jgi:uncharacterized protein YndB with AHSA1/START domain
MNYTKLYITANIVLKKQIVWDLYTNPLHIINWNFASDDWCCPRASNEVKVGGKYVGRMEAKDGSFGFDLITVYTHLVEGKSYSCEMEDGRKVDVILEAKGDLTKISIVFDPENQNLAELQKAGWQSILNNFKKYTEEN